jgi:DcmR-like sensory protein
VRTDFKVTTSKDVSKDVIWGELPPCDHLLHIYDDDASFLDQVQGFISDGLEGDESVIVIATASHRNALAHRLALAGIDVEEAIRDKRYIPLSAQDTLEKFMVRGSPDEERFNETIMGVVDQARTRGRKVRAFGEMVALLWARGLFSATLRLEQLWNQLAHSEELLVFCAYPTGDELSRAPPPFDDICAEHSRVIPG